MESINQLVRKKLEKRAYILESIEQGYANLSEISRILKEELEDEFEKEINIEAVKIAVRRFSDKAKKKKQERDKKIKKILEGSKIKLRDNLALIFSNTKLNFKDIVAFSETPSEKYAYLVDQEKAKNRKKVERNLAALILVTPGIENIPGATSYILKSLSEEEINIVALMGVGKDNIFVLKERDVPKAYQIIKSLVSGKGI